MAVKAGAKAAGTSGTARAAGAARKQRQPRQPRAGEQRPGAGFGRGPARAAQAGAEPRRRGAVIAEPAPRPFNPHADWRGAVRTTVEGLRYELVDVERVGRGLLRVTIDRHPGQAYASPGAAVTVEDCEAVTRQLQYALEVDGVDYARLEVSSPGLDRPLKAEGDYTRFAGQRIELTLKAPLQGRKHFQGLLSQAEGGGWQLVFEAGKAEQVLSFTLDEVREARLVPLVDFKGRKQVQGPQGPQDGQADPLEAAANEVDGGSVR